MAKKRILHILPSFEHGGAEQMAAYLMQYIDRSKYSVEAISLYANANRRLEKELTKKDIPIWYLNKRKGLDPKMFYGINKVIQSYKPHILHTHMSVLRYALPIVFTRQIPVKIHTVHTLAEHETDMIGKHINSLAFKKGVIPVAIANAVASSVAKVYSIENIPIIPNGIKVSDYSKTDDITRNAWRRKEGFNENSFIFVCVAGLRPVKNHLVLIDAFNKIVQRNVHLLIVGDGKTRSMLEEIIYQKGIKNQVHILGRRDDITAILQASDAFVLSSNYEGNPLSVMEAMAAGKPVISTAVGGIPELVDERISGYLVPPRKSEKLAEAMYAILTNPGRRCAMGAEAAKKALDRFDVSIMAGSYMKLYEELMQKANI